MAKNSLASSAAIMASGTLVSRVLGLVRAALLAASIATVGGAADAFSVANKLPTIIYMLIAGGVLNAVLVPQIVRAMKNEDGGHRYVNQLLTIGSTILAVLTIVLTATAGILLTVYGASMRPDWKPLALTFAYICLPQLFFYGLYTLLGQVLNARGNFGPYMWAPVLNNIVSILGLGVYLWIYGKYDYLTATPDMWDSTRIWLVAGTATAGIVSQAIVLLIPLYRSGFRITPIFSIRNSGLGRTSKVAGWAFAALLVGQLGYVAISNLAVAAGSAGEELGITVAGNATYDHAFTIFMLPQSLITVSLVTALFTRLSHHAVNGEVHAVRNQLSLGLRTLGIFTVFATAALMVLAIPIVAVILAGGPKWEAQQAMGHVVVAFSLGLVPIGVWTMVQRVYFAYEDTKSLFRIQIPMMLIILGSCAIAYFFFPPTWWVVVGAALGTTVSNGFGALISYLALRRKLSTLDGSRVLRTHVRTVLAVIPPALLGWGLLHVWGVQAGLIGSLLRVIVIGTIMGIGYLTFLRLLNVSELDSLLTRTVAMLSPITRRLAPIVNRLPGAHGLRKIGTFFIPSDPKASALGTSRNAGEKVDDLYYLHARIDSYGGEDYSIDVWDGEDSSSAGVRLVFLNGPEDRLAAATDAARRRALLKDDRFPHIIRVVDLDDEVLIVTAPVSGPTLLELITNSTLSANELRSIIGETALTLQRAHRQGMQHLMLSPESIRVHEGSISITGFGYEAALAGQEAKSADLAIRRDTLSLAHTLYAGLSSQWLGSGDVGLEKAPSGLSNAEDLHERAPDAPLDLIRLCHVTISPFDEGPATPGEFAENLRPWQPIPVLDAPALIAQDYATGEFAAITPELAASFTGEIPVVEAEVVDPEAMEQDVPPVNEEEENPGEEDEDSTPKAHSPVSTHVAPAATVVSTPLGWDVPEGQESPPVERHSSPTISHAQDGDSTFSDLPERVFPEVEPVASPATPTHHTPTPPPSARERFQTLTHDVAQQFRPVGKGTEQRFNPAGFILLAMVALVVFALILSFSSLRTAWHFDPDQMIEPTTPVTETEDDEQESEEPEEETPSEEPEEEPEEEKVEIVIKDADTFDPSSGGGENDELAELAIDGDESTFWRSFRYDNPTYAIKDGLGFNVFLEEEAEVSEVVLVLLGEGGKVEIRAGNPDDPSSGDVLASGSMDGKTTFTFDEAVETDSISLWFPELPKAESDGLNRIELAEVLIK